tara:strand:+ start:595 stop:876 length:282 start_codon:yes stop_codon:yes gene_type:complete
MSKKKKNIKKQERKIISSFEGWSSGDVAWGLTFVQGTSVYGEIVEFHPNDKHGPAATLLIPSEGKFITILVSTLSESMHKKKKQHVLRRKSIK